jgi:hypothetical protein
MYICVVIGLTRMKGFKNIVNKIGAVLIAFVLLWIIAGALVEFHQRYVFHKQVDLWQVVINTSGKDLKKTVMLFAKCYTQLLGNYLEAGQTIGEGLMYLRYSQISIFSRILYYEVTSEYQAEMILRGPPLS